MKKLFNSKFLFILASSIVVLIILVIGAFYLFEDSDDAFVKSGYVLNPLSSSVEKYFFDENAGYKENLSSMIEFKDVDDNTVTILKDSFVHYLDDSLSFLKNGAILDLDSIKGSEAVAFYNITSESIIEKSGSAYVIKTANGEIRFKNFIGRISDNKYIVVGDLNLKMSGNATTIEGEYFEVVYVEEGIVNIENKDVKYQVAAEGTLINVCSDKVIDFGDKKIMVDKEDLMSITSITINGDENIEIIPSSEEEKPEEDKGDNESGSGSDHAGGVDDSTQGGDSSSGDIGDDEGTLTEKIVVTVKNVEIGSTNIDVVFDVVNARETDSLKLQVVNLSTGRTVDMVAQVLANVPISVNLLTPNTKYLFSVVNDKDNSKIFQKTFETTGFGIKLEKNYATHSSLSYKVTVEEGTDITNAKLSLYKFNEETKQNEIVTSVYTDSVNGEVTEEKVVYLSTLEGTLSGEHEIIFDKLDSDTIYTAVLDEFSLASYNFKDIYNITLTSMTLKRTPDFSSMTISKNVDEGSFDLSLGNVDDPDNAIVDYTYMIYSYEDNLLAIDPIVYTNASPLTVKIGNKENQLKNDTNYYYKVIIEYYDNEKYIEYVTESSQVFMMGEDPYVTVIPNNDQISYDKIGFSIYLRDNSCLIAMPDREGCVGVSTVSIELYEKSSSDGSTKLVNSIQEVPFVVDGDVMVYKDGVFDELNPGTSYIINVKARYRGSEEEIQTLLHTDESKNLINTKSLSTFKVSWKSYESSANYVVNAGSILSVIEDPDAMPAEETLASVSKIILKLYTGRSMNNLDDRRPIATKEIIRTSNFDIKENFYDNIYKITSENTFDYSLDELKTYGDGKLSEYYTISINAYTDTGYEVMLNNNAYAYKINPTLYNPLSEPEINVTPITKAEVDNTFDRLTNNATYVGYTIMSAFDKTEMTNNSITPERIHYYVYNENKEQLKFYVQDDDGNLVVVDKYTIDITECVETEDNKCNQFYADIFMDYGVDYYTENDNMMRRGNRFYIGYEIEATSGGDSLILPSSTSANSPRDVGLYKFVVSAEKETPTLKMYILKSDANSITYKYTLNDVDNALYKEQGASTYGFYVKVSGGAEQKLELTKDENVSYNKFDGTFTISGMQNGSVYSLYYKLNKLKTGEFNKDIMTYLDGYTNGSRTFDGYYDVNDEVIDYNFKYQVINDSLNDNKVVIKILATESMISRIVNYQINFKDERGNTLTKNLWELNACGNDEEDVRCFEVDYSELQKAGMKSNNDKANLISVTVNAYFDNGLTGYDFKVSKTDEDADYRYMVMQSNSTGIGMGQYITINSASGEVEPWSYDYGYSIGYYSYDLDGNVITYTNELTGKEYTMKGVSLSDAGYMYRSENQFILNPKMISEEAMLCYSTSSAEDCNVFSFSSYTPKITVKEKSAMINGSVMSLKLSSADIADFENEGTNKNPEYYLFVEVWENKNDVGDLAKTVIPTIKVKINSTNPNNAVVSAYIDGLKEYREYYDENGVKVTTGKYYFNVYANMYKNNVVTYTQLFDAGYSDKYDVKTYELKTLKGNEVFNKANISFSASDVVYGNRELSTTFNFTMYRNNIAFNFDLVYVLCELKDANNGTCGPEDDDTYIFRKKIVENALSSAKIIDTVDISEYDLEYNKNYILYAYASADYYDGSQTVKRNILLNTGKTNVFLGKLSEPTFSVSREAILINGEYGIDFEIDVTDLHRTLVNGQYFVKLLDGEGNLVGKLQLLDGAGDVTSEISGYDTYALDAFVPSTKIRIVGLDAEKLYTFVVFNDAYMNNYDEDVPKEERTYEINEEVQVFSTNMYGVAFGIATYGITEKTIVVSFEGGSNFDNVTKVYYTVSSVLENQTFAPISGEFTIGENNKYFSQYMNSDDWVFIIDPSDMQNILGRSYNISIQFDVLDPVTKEIKHITSVDNSSFDGTIKYVDE